MIQILSTLFEVTAIIFTMHNYSSWQAKQLAQQQYTRRHHHLLSMCVTCLHDYSPGGSLFLTFFSQPMKWQDKRERMTNRFPLNVFRRKRNFSRSTTHTFNQHHLYSTSIVTVPPTLSQTAKLNKHGGRDSSLPGYQHRF